MHVTPAFGTPQRSLAYARVRDERIVWLLSMHPVTAGMLVTIGWFPTRAKALKRLHRLVQKKAIRFCGTVRHGHGRSEHVFCHWQVKNDDLLHEVELTELCLRIDAKAIRRGPHVRDDRIRPDAEVVIKHQLYYLELDRGSMGYAQMRRRFQLYEGFREFVLWVCPNPVRCEGLRKCAEGIRSSALFTTLAEGMSSPHAAIWIDVRGEQVSLPREGPVAGA